MIYREFLNAPKHTLLWMHLNYNHHKSVENSIERKDVSAPQRRNLIHPTYKSRQKRAKSQYKRRGREATAIIRFVTWRTCRYANREIRIITFSRLTARSAVELASIIQLVSYNRSSNIKIYETITTAYWRRFQAAWNRTRGSSAHELEGLIDRQAVNRSPWSYSSL